VTSLAGVRVGLAILPEHRWRDAAAMWRRAEECGFDHAWTYDHLGWRTLLDEPWFDAVPTLTAAATVTATIPLGLLVASPNFRHPVPFARQLLALDDISGGRLLIGIGSGGGGGYDDSVMGNPSPTLSDRMARFREFVELTDLLLRQSRTTFAGRFFSAVDARSVPGPVQRPRPPIVVAANGPRSMRIAVAHGDAWVTTGPVTDHIDEWWRGVGELARRFDEVVDASAGGRADGPIPMDRYLHLDASPQYSLSSLGCFADAVGRAHVLGFTDVIVCRPRPSGVYAGRAEILDDVAAALASRPDASRR